MFKAQGKCKDTSWYVSVSVTESGKRDGIITFFKAQGKGKATS